MKKAFIQKLSIAMATAMVITAAAPATADAAKKMGLNAKSKVLYLNADNKSKTPSTFDFNITNKEKDYKKKYNFTWYADNESIVDVAKGGVVTALKPGKTVVKCDITTKKGKLKQTLEATVEVKANAKTVVIKNQPDGPMTVGTKFDFNRTMKNADGGKATDKTEWFVSADAEGKEATDVASIESNGMVTALKAGTFYVTAKTYQSEKHKDKGYTAVSEPVKVEVALSMTEINLKKANTIDVVFDSSVKDVITKNTDIEIVTATANKNKSFVKSFKVSEDGKTVTVETYQNFTNDIAYTVKAADASKDFTAKIGTIKSIVVEDQVVAPVTDPANAKELPFTVYDEYGVDISNSYSYKSGSIEVESSFSGASHVDNNGKMQMGNKGDSVSVRLKFVKYNATTGADESIVSNVATVTCADIAATATTKWTIASATASNPWEKINNTITAKDQGMKIYAELKDNFGNKLDSNYRFESQNPDVLVSDDAGNIYAYKPGTAIVKVISGDYSDYLAITVKAEATYNGVTASVNQHMLSNSTELDVADSKEVTYTLKDIYGEKFDSASETGTLRVTDADGLVVISGTGVTQISSDNGISEYSVPFVDGEAKVTYTVAESARTGNKTGSISARLVVKDKAASLSMQVKAPAGATTYRLDLSSDKVDNFTTTDGKNVLTAKLYCTDNANVLYDECTGSTYGYELKNAKGEIKKSGNFASTDALVSNNVLTIDAKDLGLEVGTYTITIKNGPTSKPYTFEVTSGKKSSSVTLTANTVDAKGRNDVSEILKGITKFVVDGNEVDKKDVTVKSYKYFVQTNGTITGNAGIGTVTGGSLNWVVGTELKDKASLVVLEVTFIYDGVEYTCAVADNTQITINR